MKMKKKETWKDVVGYEGFYRVSNLGRFKSLDRETTHNYGGIAIKKGKILKTQLKGGYHGVTLVKNGITKYTFLHRIVAMAFKKNPKNKPCVNHKDGNKSNNSSKNLEWVTYLENQTHADKTGLRDVRGHLNGRAKLTIDNVHDILKLQSSITTSMIAKKYGVSYQNISSIIKRKSWCNI